MENFKNKFIEKANKIKNKKIKVYKAIKENGDLYATIKPKEISKIIFDELKTEIGPSEIIIKHGKKNLEEVFLKLNRVKNEL